MTTSNFEKAFEQASRLVDDFRANERHYLSPTYQEQEARHDFIDKLLIALGWDVNHESQKNPFEQEVKVERSVSMQGSQRRADYAFYIEPNFRDVRFYIEAKKPHGDIATKDNYFQTIRYGWNSQTPIAVLTDFEQFHLLDCRYKPDIDTALNHAIEKFHYTDYADQEKFARIFFLFSREAVGNGSIESFAATLAKPRGKAVQRGLFKGGYQSIDESFLEELDEHRTTLARDFKANNLDLDGPTLTELTQRTLDRLVFIRFLEDKLIEPENLVAKFGVSGTAWHDFIATSRRLDSVYNGIVFKKHNLLDDRHFHVDEDSFADICEKLAHINSPYDFNSIPIHILGSIYERFLGKVIVSTDKRAQVQDKPEVRKHGGVYYTPENIVRFIVEKTVGKLTAGKTPAQISGMRFGDIACGSGSFLLGIYDLLLRYHTKYYNDNPSKAKKGECVERDGALHLSLSKKREIALNNIYGVDIDAQAVEVAQLSIYLKMLEDETTATARGHQLEFRETLLPSLNKNIICGNSLIGTDVLDGKLFESEGERSLNPMNFEDRFPELMNEGGFDVIVGNPPYLFLTELNDLQKDYFFGHYKTCEYRFDVYGLFIETSLKHLLKPRGYLSFIIPHTLLSNDSFERLRRLILEQSFLDTVIDIGPGVFHGAKNETMIFVARNGFTKDPRAKTHVLSTTAKHFPVPFKQFSVRQDAWQSNPRASWLVNVSSEETGIIKTLEQAQHRMGDFCTINQGLRTGDNEKYLSNSPRSKKWKPAAGGKEVGRYEPLTKECYVYYEPEILDAPRRREIFESEEKVVIQEIRNITLTRRLIATYDNKQFYCLQSTNVINLREGITEPSIKFILGILNSAAANFFFRQRFPGNNHIPSNQLAMIPIPSVSPQQHAKIVHLVDQMLDGKQMARMAKTDRDKDYYEAKCTSLDRQIDTLVFGLYGLTKSDIQRVEENTRPEPSMASS